MGVGRGGLTMSGKVEVVAGAPMTAEVSGRVERAAIRFRAATRRKEGIPILNH